MAAAETDLGYNCNTSGGAAGRGVIGPFGLLVLADDGLSEQTAVYFYVARKPDGEWGTFVCQDELRLSLSLSLLSSLSAFIRPLFLSPLSSLFHSPDSSGDQ